MNVNTWKLPETGKLCCIVYISICPRALFVSNVESKESRHGPCFQKITWSNVTAMLVYVCSHYTLYDEGKAWAPTVKRLQFGGGRAQVGTFQVEWEGRGKRKKPKKKPETEHSESPKLDMGMMSSRIQNFTFPNHDLLINRQLSPWCDGGSGEGPSSRLAHNCRSWNQLFQDRALCSPNGSVHIVCVSHLPA